MPSPPTPASRVRCAERDLLVDRALDPLGLDRAERAQPQHPLPLRRRERSGCSSAGSSPRRTRRAFSRALSVSVGCSRTNLAAPVNCSATSFSSSGGRHCCRFSFEQPLERLLRLEAVRSSSHRVPEQPDVAVPLRDRLALLEAAARLGPGLGPQRLQVRQQRGRELGDHDGAAEPVPVAARMQRRRTDEVAVLGHDHAVRVDLDLHRRLPRRRAEVEVPAAGRAHA